VVGAGISGLTAASHLARGGCAVTVYETGRGPGGRTSTRRAGPDGAGWQFDHGAQYFAAKDPAFRDIVEDWRAEGLVAEWTGVFGTLDATTGTFVREDVSETKERWVGTPSMNAVAKGLARRPGISLVTSRRVTSFEGGPGVGDGTWTVVHRSSAPTATTDDPGAKTDPVPAEPPRRDARFVAVVAADKQTASDRSVRVYGEDPPLLSLDSPAVWKGMRASGQTPSFALMLAVKNGRKSGAGADDEDGAKMNAEKTRLFEFQGATVEGDDVVAWIADDSSKPGRRTGAPDADVTCWVVQSTPAYAARRVKAMATVPGTAPHQALLNEVAEEMTEALLALAAKCAGGSEMEIEIAHAAAHRWGAAFPDDGAVAAAAASGKGCLSDAGRRVVGCGDFCVAPKIEGAALSGAAAAARVAEMIADAPAASL
jgi:predicted NAD/FAD-dependent oxidoreductase